MNVTMGSDNISKKKKAMTGSRNQDDRWIGLDTTSFTQTPFAPPQILLYQQLSPQQLLSQ